MNATLHASFQYMFIAASLYSVTFDFIFLTGAYYLLACILPIIKPKKLIPNTRLSTTFWPDLGYTLLSAFIFQILTILFVVAYRYNLTYLYIDIHDYSLWYFAFTIVLMILVHDTYFYWMHRMLHTRWFFKHVHYLHHQSRDPNVATLYRFHPIEAMLQPVAIVGMAFIIPVNVWVYVVVSSFYFWLALEGHCGFEFRPAKCMRLSMTKWLTTSTHHYLHHQNCRQNFGIFLRVWDRLMKTETPNYEEHFVKNASRKVTIAPPALDNESNA